MAALQQLQQRAPRHALHAAPQPLMAAPAAARHATRRLRRPDGLRCRSGAAAAPGATAADASPAGVAAVAEAFKAWYVEHARDMPADLTPRPAAGPHGGFCMVTSEPVARGAPLLAVPRSLLMSAETARSSPACAALLERSDLDDWQALILHLLLECADPASRWAPYLAVLRAADMSRHPLLWGDARRAWLAGSPMARLLDARRAQVAGDAAALVAAGANALPAAAGLGRPLVSEASVGWAAAVLLSRAFSLYLAPEPDHEILPMDDFGSWDRSGQDVLALVPWADMLQHSSESGDASVLRYDVETDTTFLCAHTDYAAGDEVYDSYGPGLAPCDLLMDYGFVDPANGNARYDAAPSDIAAPRGPRNRALLEALDRLQGEGALLALGPSGPDTTGLTVLRAALASEAELVKAGWRLRAGPRDLALAARVMGRLAEPGSAATEGAVLAALGAYCGAALEAYPSSLEEDEAEAAALERDLAAAASGGSGGAGGGGAEASGEGEGAGGVREADLRLQVLRALIAEKRALAGSAAAVDAWRAALAGGCAPGELYPGADGSEGDGSDDEGGPL